MPNAHLDALHRRYGAARDAIAEIQTRAADDGDNGRDLTVDELREVEAHTATATRLAGEVETVTAQETRNRAVAAAAASIAAGDAAAGTGDGTGGDSGQGLGAPEQRRSATATRDRDPGHYRSETDGGERSFFGDLVRAREGDRDAATRLDEHNRALSTPVAGAGIVAPNWLLGEYEALARQGRMLSAAVRNIAITNPSPMTLQRQTLGTDNVIAEQATENTHPSETDSFATDVDVVIPKPTSGIQVISRQMLDMGTPAADLLIYGDMAAVYNRKVEDKVCAGVAAAAGPAVLTMTEAQFATAVGAAGDAITDAAFDLWDARKLPATVVAMRVRRWGRFNKLRDADGRKLYPASDAGPMNVDGVGSINASGNVEGLPVMPTDGLGIGGTTYPENILVLRASDAILFEGAMQRFRYEEVAGPESVKIGIWAYTAFLMRQATKSVRRVAITAV